MKLQEPFFYLPEKLILLTQIWFLLYWESPFCFRTSTHMFYYLKCGYVKYLGDTCLPLSPRLYRPPSFGKPLFWNSPSILSITVIKRAMKTAVFSNFELSFNYYSITPHCLPLRYKDNPRSFSFSNLSISQEGIAHILWIVSLYYKTKIAVQKMKKIILMCFYRLTARWDQREY